MDLKLNPVLTCLILAALKDWPGLSSASILHVQVLHWTVQAIPLQTLRHGLEYAGMSQASWRKDQNNPGIGKLPIYPFPLPLALLPISEGKWAKAWCFLVWMWHFDIAKERGDQTSSTILNSGKQRSSMLSIPASGKVSLDQTGNQMLMFQRFLSFEVF